MTVPRKAAGIHKVTVAVAVGALSLASCTGGGTPTAAEDGPDSGSVTITYLVGQPENPSDVKLIEQDIDSFEAKNSGITVELKTINPDSVRTVLQTQLRSGSGPDVFGYDTGPGFAGVLADAGLLYDLTGAYEKNGWKIYDWAKQRVTFDGKILGVPDQVEEVGVYYNKDIFDKASLAPPKDLADFARIADTLKSNGVTPLSFGNKEGWQGGHILSMALSSAVGQTGMEDLLAGRKSWADPEVVDAISLFFDQYQKAGYLPKSPNAITGDNANALFYSGKAAMTPTGTWLVRDIQSTVKFEVGFFPFPAPDGKGIFAGGLGGGTFVSAKTRHPDAAVKLLDYLVSAEHGRWQVEKYHTIPAFPVDVQGADTEPLFGQILADTAKISSGEGEFGFNIDVLTNDEFNKAMWEGLQSVLVGTKTPRQVAEEMQEAFEPPTAGE